MMVQFIVNESQHQNVAGDLTCYPSLDILFKHIERIDVESHEYQLFDDQGFFYEVRFDEGSGNYSAQKRYQDLLIAERIIDDYLGSVGADMSNALSISDKSLLIDRYL